MSSDLLTAFAAAVLLHMAAADVSPHPGPFDGKTFRGRIAYSSDGNFNDEDDWAASPMVLAILAACGLQEKLVHFDYNNILPRTDAEWEKQHATGVLGAAQRHGFRGAVFHDCQKDLEGAIESIKNAINASSAEDPLYFILAGPMEVPARGIERSDPAKRKFVYCISHSRWNDGYASVEYVKHNKRDVIPLGVTWIQITDQNARLSTSPYGRPAVEEEWVPWHWMRDSRDPKVRFLWERMRATKRADCSDAGMAYFLVSGDEHGDPEKLRKLLEERVVPMPINPRPWIRLEAENFRALEGCEVEYRNDRAASHRIAVRLGEATTGAIRTRLDEPYAAPRGPYDVDVRYAGGGVGGAEFKLFVNEQQEATWKAPLKGAEWQTVTVHGVQIGGGDEIRVELRRGPASEARVDYVQLNVAAASGEWTARQVAVLEGFEAPECVVVDENSGTAYVSNIAARHDPTSREQYWAEDGTGFISRLKPGGAIDRLRWRESTAALPLNSPKGMCILRGQLEVNDISHLSRFPLADDQPGRRMSLEGARRLNDMATDGKAVYASDMAQGVIYRLDGEGVKKLRAPEGVNGITFFGARMFAVSRTLHDVYELDPSGAAAPKPFGLAAHFSGLDGIEVLADGTFIVSDIAGNKVCAISPDRKAVRTLVELETPADIGLDHDRMLLYVPQLMKDRVVVYQLDKR